MSVHKYVKNYLSNTAFNKSGHLDLLIDHKFSDSETHSFRNQRYPMLWKKTAKGIHYTVAGKGDRMT